MATAAQLSLTPRAVEQVLALREKQGFDPEHALRVRVVGGGCSGYSYQLDFDGEGQADDAVLEFSGLSVRVDPESAQYLEGVEIDFVTKLSGGGFTFTNPNATQTCGCGTSFSV